MPISSLVRLAPRKKPGFPVETGSEPVGIMRSAVPLPWFFDVVTSQKVAGQRPQQGTKSCRMGRNSVRPSAHPLFGWSIHPLSKGFEGRREGSEGSRGLPEGCEGLTEGSEGL